MRPVFSSFSFCLRPFRFLAGGRFFIRLSFSFLICLLLAQPASGQFKFREAPNRQDPRPLAGEEGEAIWNAFKANRALGSFVLQGRLIHRPPRDPSRRYGLRLEGTWTEKARSTTIRLRAPDGIVTTHHLRMEGGSEEKTVFFRDEDTEAWERAESARLQEPLLPGLPFSRADLLMTYLEWEVRHYKGPDRLHGRPAHVFALHNPREHISPSRVEVWLDEDYAAILRIDIFATEKERTARIRVGGFREYSSGWMFSSLIWENRRTRDRIRLEVEDFSLHP